MKNKPPESGATESTEPVAPIEESATFTPSQPDILTSQAMFLRPLLKPAFWVVVLSLLGAR